jgi:hypothetical protein
VKVTGAGLPRRVRISGMRNDAMNKAIPFVIALVGLGTIPGSSSLFDPSVQPNVPVEFRPDWTEFRWPFLLDQWGVGRAFVCKPADCGTEVKVYVRPKFGFCNCTTGVVDDEELDRVGDKELIAADAVASGRGRAIEIAWMKGRSRSFESGDATRARLLSIAFHDRCDLMVAVATFAPGNQDAVEPVVIAFLNSDRVLRWVKWLTL